MVLNLLTLDWDFFFTASEEVRKRCFQIYWAEDVPQDVVQFAWAMSYCDFADELLDIKVKPETYEILHKIKLKRSAPVVICRTHEHAYYFFSRMLRDYRKTPRLNLLNMDHHSDTLHEIKGLTGPMEKGVHCGNWLYCFMQEAKGNYYWLCNEDSVKIDLPPSMKFCTDIKDTPLDSLAWDAVLICRSDIWSPPHLDDDFTKIFKSYIDGKYSSVIEPDIWQSRYPVIRDLAHDIKEPPADFPEDGRKMLQAKKNEYVAIRTSCWKSYRQSSVIEKFIKKFRPEIFK